MEKKNQWSINTRQQLIKKLICGEKNSVVRLHTCSQMYDILSLNKVNIMNNIFHDHVTP